MSRKLFCQYSPTAYRISALKCRAQRRLADLWNRAPFAETRSTERLPFAVCRHNSLIRRRLGNVDMALQENKAVNLGLAAPCIDRILIRPGETFSFWRLVGEPSARRGYLDGLTIANGETLRGVGGGMCQFTNLIHWMVLHSPLEITEYHHHDSYDLFPDFGRQIPFGTGTSILYNYLDYRFRNPTETVYQLVVYTTAEHLCGELRADDKPEQKYHIKAADEQFVREGSDVYRVGEVWRECVDVRTGNLCSRELLRVNHAKVMYDTSEIRQ